MKHASRRALAMILSMILVFGMLPFIQTESVQAKTVMFTVSKKAGTYSNSVKPVIKAKAGYKVYYTTNGKFTTGKVVNSGKKKTLTIKKTTTLQLIAVKKSASPSAKKLNSTAYKKKIKKFKYTIKTGTTNSNSALAFDMSKWSYDADNNVYYQIGVAYCEKPEASAYESLGIYVPGEYLTGVKNSDGTYTCTINKKGNKSGYTALTAPIILPVDTPGYAAQAAPTTYNYNSVSDYVGAGFVYILAGMRGRSSMQGTSTSQGFSGGAPYGVTDLKAAVRYYRYNDAILPGDDEKMFTYGMSGGGAQSAVMGASGDSALYTPYLKSIGAAMTDSDGKTISDAIAGSMCWCPITSLDIADEAYEWNMGQYFTTSTRADSTFTSALSDDLAGAFADYINDLGLKSEDGTTLTLQKSESGIYASGTYYDYILSEIETSLNNFLKDTTFPYQYTQTSIQVGNTPDSGAGMDFGSGDTGSGQKPDFGDAGSGQKPDFGGNGGGNGAGGRNGFGGTAGFGEAVTYETAQDYIDALNKDTKWITYDAATNTAKITSIADFVTQCKNATKSVGAFDSMTRSQGENNVYGNGQDESRHFDAIEAQLLKNNASAYAAFSDWDASLISAFEEDLASKDALGVTMQTRVNMYNPLYFLSDHYAGSTSGTPAKYWRIRTGINQTDTALTTEENLKLVLQSNRKVKSVDFATVWGQPHTTAERTGTSTANFISWVNECAK